MLKLTSLFNCASDVCIELILLWINFQLWNAVVIKETDSSNKCEARVKNTVIYSLFLEQYNPTLAVLNPLYSDVITFAKWCNKNNNKLDVLILKVSAKYYRLIARMVQRQSRRYLIIGLPNKNVSTLTTLMVD